jgi:hypothetical protein
MRTGITLAVTMVLLIFSACNKGSGPGESADLSGDYFIFGNAFGECAGSCASFYRLGNGKLSPDSMSYYLRDRDFRFSSTRTLSAADYKRAQYLWNHFPAELYKYSGTVIGCPDCHDQGGMYIEMKKGSTVYYWEIDHDTDKQPPASRAYLEQMALTIFSMR